MGIRFLCEHCDKRLNVKSFLAGKKGLCPHCGGRIRIPLESQVATTTSAGNHAAGSSDEDDSSGGSDASWSALGTSEPQAAGPVVDVAARTEGAVWYVSPPGGGQYGPAPRETVEQWISEGRITADTLVWCDGWDEWEVASRHFVQFQLAEHAESVGGENVERDFPLSGAVEAATPASLHEARSTGDSVGATTTKYVLGRSAEYRGTRQRSFFWIAVFSFLAILLLGALALVLIFGSS